MTAADSEPQPLPTVCRTAVWTAEMRADESLAPNPCAIDPWAAEFVTAAGPQGPPPGDAEARAFLHAGVAVRTRYFDDYLIEAVRGGCPQVVLLGAGLDTRAFRLPWPERVDVFEVDLPDLLDFKNRVVAGRVPASARRVTVAADLREAWADALTASGFDPARRTAWLCEGLLAYLEPDEADAVVRTMGEHSPPGSRVGVETATSQGRLSCLRSCRDALSADGAPWRWSLRDPGPWWAERGWRMEQPDPASLPYAAERLAPYLPLLREAGDTGGWLLTGTRCGSG
ncbi:SAM-dependent methyltransferase [Actinacidiphila oryziradicis]|uniref:S-adenosyl-L-methionine-dependent methyltransferase n=1 Tax=Actinacidiphila oryziradicis TaxID=2571141 RepID=A0A4U0SEW5_9ACTN|nr:SAM-dependent methyltransferase [Actinacidiphila oryziradicis]TJZ98804.1 SAM-dependent methyltransferase [Actinacidiphila oryziradicis]